MTTLSFIESGCLPAAIGGHTVFLVKAPQAEIDSLKEKSGVFLSFECIKRPEFPSVRVHITFKDKADLVHRFDCFFNIDSDDDMELLEKLRNQEYLTLVFLSSNIEYSRRVEISEADRENMNRVAQEARS